ncbi:MAG: DEAD/DEAH box helicase, partial [Ilumatobacteraceae bacterium]
MNAPSSRPSGRRRANRRDGRRRDTSNSSPRTDHDDDGEERAGNLTTINALPPVEPPTGFAELGVPERIDDGLAACGFAQPFAIQTEAVPVAMHGRDVCGRAKTGSGKTLAFGVPMLARITDRAEPRKPLGLVLVPTRELAVQVAEVLEPIAKHADMRVLAVYGGASRHGQIDELAKGVELVVATPLRLIDLIKSNEVDLGAAQIVCLDEADRMADDGFTPQVEWILRHCTGRSQTMLFSATLDGDVGHLIRHYLTDPIEVAIDAATDTVGTMHHLFLAVHHMDKDKVVGAIGQGIPKIVVFCQTKRSCDKVARNLQDLGVQASAIHGDLPQKSRERALQRFAEGKLDILVATDVAARGIDIDDIGAVIHYEPA